MSCENDGVSYDGLVRNLQRSGNAKNYIGAAPVSIRPRCVGESGLVVSELGFGCSSLGGGLFGPDTSGALDLVARCLDAGVTFFDTSDTYSLGNSEKILGRAVRGRRSEVVLATKGGGTWNPLDKALLRSRPLLRPFRKALGGARKSIKLAHARRKHYDYSPEHIVRAVEGSLRRLGTDYIDLYQLYNPTVRDLVEFECSEVLDSLKAAGKIRHYGVTAYSLEDALAALKHPSIESIQLSISLIDQSALGEFLTLARARGVGVIAASALGEGLLTGQAGGVTKADESSHHTASQLDVRRARAAVATRWVRPDRTMAQTALRFALAIDGISLALPSAVTLDQLNENLATFETPELTDSELAEMRALETSVPLPGQEITVSVSSAAMGVPVAADMAMAKVAAPLAQRS